MYVCEDKEQSKALLHFYTINTFWLKREITSVPRQRPLSGLWSKFGVTAIKRNEAFLKGIGKFTSLLVNWKYLHACLTVLKYNASRVLSSWEWAASGRRPNQSCAGQVKGGSTMVYRQMAPPRLFSVPLCEYIGTRVKMCTTQWCAVNELNTTQTV